MEENFFSAGWEGKNSKKKASETQGTLLIDGIYCFSVQQSKQNLRKDLGCSRKNELGFQPR